MKHLLVLAALVLTVSAEAVAQTKQSQPSLKETLEWMQNTLDLNGNEYMNEETRSIRLTSFSECRVYFRYTTTKGGTETYRDDDSFSLADIDPAYVIFHKFPKGHIREGFGVFGAGVQNDAKKIDAHLSSGDSKRSDISFVMDAEYGVRFTNAFKHAVNLCGGKSSITAFDEIPNDTSVQPTKAKDRPSSQLLLTPKDIPGIAQAANAAIVTIVTATGDKPIAQGTGFLVSADGLIVTNYHVIQEGNVAVVKFSDGAVLSVDGVLAADKVRDLAVIKVHGKTFRTLILGDSDHVQVGEEVVAIGNPLGLELTVSNGILSGVRTVEKEGGKFLQITAPISHGSSGGPLFNMQGEVVGITSMYFAGGENLNFAIPVNDAKRLLLDQSAKLHELPNESASVSSPKQAHPEDSPPSASNIAGNSTSRARGYYQQLFDAGGFSKGLPNAVCFSDDANSETFFTFTAYAYDQEYYDAQARVQALHPVPTDPDIVTPEMEVQFKIMERVQQSTPYATFLMKGWLDSLAPKVQQFFRGGGRILDENVYDKGVKTNTLEYHWDGSSWLLSIPPTDPKAYTRVSRILHLNIEPNTMCYVDSAAVTTTVGFGEVAATDTTNHGPWGGICERVPNSK